MKLVGIFDYWRLAYEFEPKNALNREDIEARAGTSLIPVLQSPDGEWRFDTTPIALDLDRLNPGAALLPPDPVAGLLVRIVEEFFDEWVTRFAVHFRWYPIARRGANADGLVRELAALPPAGELDEGEIQRFDVVLGFIGQWADARCGGIGAGADEHEALRAQFIRLLGVLERVIGGGGPFLFGSTPGLADFALYGGLQAHFLADPDPEELVRSHAPSLLAYRDRLATADSSEFEWSDTSFDASKIAPLIEEMEHDFAPFLTANRDACRAGEATLTLRAEGQNTEVQTRRYTEKSRAIVADEIQALAGEDQERLKAVIGSQALWGIFATR